MLIRGAIVRTTMGLGQGIRDGRGNMARFEPIAVDVEEAVVGPVARGDEQDEEQDGAVDAGPVQEIGQEEECYDEAR